MTANPAGDPARARDLTRLRELTKPYLPNPGAPIQQALPHMGRPTSPRSLPSLAASVRRTQASPPDPQPEGHDG